METEKLYYQDPFLWGSAAVVLSCEAAEHGFLVTLDRTVFYPEGGGQPSDRGTLNGIPVTDVQERDGVVFHTCERSVEIGETVTGQIDWERRFDHMQQHSGEHILSGILCRDYHCNNVGFHMGAETVTIDYDAEITWEQALAAERKANAIIWEDRPVEIAWPTPAELAALDYRSKKELTGAVRIVTFPGADCCACCGTHVRRAGQVGLVKILSCQKFREGVRMEILCGQRALTYLSSVYDQSKAIGQHLSVKPAETLPAVERLAGELETAKARSASMEEQLFSLIAAGTAGKGDVLLFQPPLRGDSLRRLADAIARRCGGLAAVFAGEKGAFQYALIRSDGAEIAPLVKELNQALSGRGGGRGGFAQGSVQADSAAILSFFQTKEIHPCDIT